MISSWVCSERNLDVILNTPHVEVDSNAQRAPLPFRVLNPLPFGRRFLSSLVMLAPFPRFPSCPLPKIKAPILFVAAEYDEQCPADKVREAVAQAHDAKLSLHYNTHFDMYLGETLQVSCRRISLSTRSVWCPQSESKKLSLLQATFTSVRAISPHRGDRSRSCGVSWCPLARGLWQPPPYPRTNLGSSPSRMSLCRK